MRKAICFLVFLWLLATPVSALELEPPRVPAEGAGWMPEDTDSLAGGLEQLLGRAVQALGPDLETAAGETMAVVCCMLAMSLLGSLSDPARRTARTALSCAAAAILLRSLEPLVDLGMGTVDQIRDYSRLLLPVMTAALAAQGGVTASAALYAGTVLFDAVLSTLIAGILVPGIRLFLAVRIAGCAIGEDMLKKLAQLLRDIMQFLLKVVLMVFTTYLGLTGVVSGTTDAAALKAAKVTISTVVPVVGGILSDAGESVLVSAGLMKSAAGVYGILAVLALFLGPFVRLGAHYLVLKVTAALCAIFGEKPMTELLEGFSTAMGLLLAMTGAGCMMSLISTVCFLRGVG